MSAAIAATPDAPAEAKPKSKKLLFIVIGAIVLALIGAGGALFILKKNTADLEDDADEDVMIEHKVDTSIPPTFLALDSMVVNLADPGGNRFVQLAITLQVQDTKTSEAIKNYMPSIRNGILMVVSQRTAEEILKAEGKEQLAKDIVALVSQTMGYATPDHVAATESGKKPRRLPPSPLHSVLFSSFIVQ